MALYIKHTDGNGAIDCTGVSVLVCDTDKATTAVTFNGEAMTKIWDGNAGNTNNWWMLRNPAQGSYTASVTGGALNCSIGLRAATLRGAGETTASQNVNCVPPDAVNGDLILAHGGASNQPKDVGTEAPAGSLYDWNNASYGQEIAYMENATYNYVNFTCSGSNVLNSECAFYETPEIKAAVAIAPNMML